MPAQAFPPLRFAVQLLPVIDLMGGVVVRGIAGQRNAYRPLQSRLCAEPNPSSVAAALVKQFGLHTIYIADLDAIGGLEPDWTAYRAMEAAGGKLWIDAGAGDVQRAQRIASACPDAHVIVGLESLREWSALATIVETLGADRILFSLDLKQGAPLLRSDATLLGKDVPPGRAAVLEIARRAIACGVKRLIVLDLAAVGTSSGPVTLDLCQQLGQLWPDRRWIGGGGVRDVDDVLHLARAGCAGVLVASALHDGRITPADMRPWRDGE